jgi:hypothetical protein
MDKHKFLLAFLSSSIGDNAWVKEAHGVRYCIDNEKGRNIAMALSRNPPMGKRMPSGPIVFDDTQTTQLFSICSKRKFPICF